MLGGNAGSLVGVAISASLLPPAVNAGLFWALALVLAAGGTASSVGDPDSQDPHVFGPPGSGSICQRYGSGSGSGSFYQQAKIVRKTLILRYFLTFIFEK